MPFAVTAGDTKTVVLGTAFEVRRHATSAYVSGQHGKVQVAVDGSSPDQTQPLVAGQWLLAGSTGDIRRGMSPPDEVAAWRRGELIVRDRSVRDVIDMLGQYHLGAVLLLDDTFGARRVSGVYRLEDPAATLRDLAASHGARMRAITPWLLIISKP
jgi:transmembrane sensor